MMVCFGDALGPCRTQSQPFCVDFTSLKIEGQGIDQFQSISQNPTVNPVYDFYFSSLRLRSKNEITKLQKERVFIPALFLKWNFISMLFHTWKIQKLQKSIGINCNVSPSPLENKQAFLTCWCTSFQRYLYGQKSSQTGGELDI